MAAGTTDITGAKTKINPEVDDPVASWAQSNCHAKCRNVTATSTKKQNTNGADLTFERLAMSDRLLQTAMATTAMTGVRFHTANPLSPSTHITKKPTAADRSNTTVDIMASTTKKSVLLHR
jgi:hypothetical protein